LIALGRCHEDDEKPVTVLTKVIDESISRSDVQRNTLQRNKYLDDYEFSARRDDGLVARASGTSLIESIRTPK